jgi:hypothetical protein
VKKAAAKKPAAKKSPATERRSRRGRCERRQRSVRPSGWPLHARSSPWGHASASRTRRHSGSKRRRVHSPQPGDSLGTKDAPSRVIRRWKAPRVQPIAVLFAGDRVKRPYEGTHRQSVRAGRARQGPS